MVFIIDILVNFRTGYVDNHGVEEMQPRKVACAYAKNWLLLDIISAVPESAGNYGLENLKIFKSTKVLKSIRLLKLSKFLKISGVTRIVNSSYYVVGLLNAVSLIKHCTKPQRSRCLMILMILYLHIEYRSESFV